MKIIQCITRSEKGGSQIDVAHLFEGYPYYEQTLVSGEEGWLTEYACSSGIEVVIAPSLIRQINPMRDWRAFEELKAVFQRIKPDLVHLHTAKAGLIGRLAARSCGIPNVYTPHGWSFSGRSSMPLQLLSEAVELAAKRLSGVVIAVSEYEKKLAIERGVCDENQIRVVYNGIPQNALQAQHNEIEIPIVAMVARFAPPKQQEAVLQALSSLREPFKLLFIGDGPTRPYLERLSAASPIANQVEFLGTRFDVDRILSEADILVHASHYEALCMSVVEAMRARLPVVVWSKGGIEELVVPGITGYIARNAQGFCRCVQSLLQSHKLREEFGDAARARYLSMFTVESMLRKTAEIYNDLIETGVAERKIAA